MRFFRTGVGITPSSFLVLLNGRLGWRARYLRVNPHRSLASALQKHVFVNVSLFLFQVLVSVIFKMLLNC